MKALLALTCTAAVLVGWEKSPPSPPQISDFPVSADQEWFTKETYLILKPYEEGNDYATRLKTKGSLTTELDFSVRLQKPKFDWASGLRLGIGRYLAKHDKWDISLFTTYFYAQEKSSSSPKRSQNALLTPLWSPTFEGGATKGHVLWRLNFFNWDLSVGREYQFLKTVTAHPFIGLRVPLIYKNYDASYVDNSSGHSLKDKFKASDHFWGIGPRFGSDFQFSFAKNWAFLGSLSGALFFGHYQIKEDTQTQAAGTGARYRTSDGHYSIRANLDTSLGLGWEVWLRRGRVRIAPSVLFEASCWFNTNRFFLAKPSSASMTGMPDFPSFTNFRRNGNLILMGVSLNLQTDF